MAKGELSTIVRASLIVMVIDVLFFSMVAVRDWDQRCRLGTLIAWRFGSGFI